MALKSWLTSLKADVSSVSGVQAPIHAGLGRYVTDTADVSGVSGSGGTVASDTADTAGNMQAYQAQPAWALACTGDTADTCIKINTEAHAANELLYGDLLTGWNATIPDGVSAATLAKFRAASLALDASIVAAGGSLALPGERTTQSEPTTPTTTTTTAQPHAKKPLFRQRGPWLTGTEQSAAQDYHAHHFNCHQCISAGRGDRYGRRCAVGLALWSDYTGTDDLQTEGSNHGQA